MNATNEKQPTCAERVADATESRLEDLRAMLDPSAEDLTLSRYDRLDEPGFHVLFWGDYPCAELTQSELRDIAERCIDPSDLADEPENDPSDVSQWSGDFRVEVLEEIFSDFEDAIREAGREAFSEYGLAFDYVEPGTFPDLEEGFFRYQISFGGPSEEIRFYASRAHNGWCLYRAEFWYLDWFDGALEIVTHDPRAIAVWSEFNDSETVEHVFNQAMEA